MARLDLNLLVEQVQAVQERRHVHTGQQHTSTIELALDDLAAVVEDGGGLEPQIALLWH